jgi:hypothetical protein
MHALHILLFRDREVAFDDDGYDAAVLGYPRHVQGNVSASDGTIPEQLLQNAGNFLVRYFRVFRVPERRGRE